MQQKSQTNSPQQNKKSFAWDNLAGIIALVAVVAVILYVISTHLTLPVLIVPSDAVEMTYPASILGDAAEDMAESMLSSDGVYRANVNEDGSLTVKMTPERKNSIVEAAENAVNTMTLVSISEETAIRDYYAVNDHTELCFTVFKDAETLSDEIKNSVYTARLYHICNNNLDVKIKAYYTDALTGETYLCEQYDIDGNITGTADGALVLPEKEVVEAIVQ